MEIEFRHRFARNIHESTVSKSCIRGNYVIYQLEHGSASDYGFMDNMHMWWRSTFHRNLNQE